MSEQFFRCSLLVFSEKKTPRIFCFTLSGVKMLESFFRAHLLGKRVSRFMCQNVVLLFTRCCHSVLIKEVSWICFTISGVQVSVGIFRSCLFVCQRVSRFQMVVLLYLGVVSQFFIKGVPWIFWLTFSGVQVSEFVCQGFVVRGFQTVSLFVKAVEVFIGSVYCQRFSTVNLLKMLKCFFRPHEFCLSEDFMV